MNPTALIGAGAVPLIAGITQVLKSTGLPARFAPLAAMILGAAVGVLGVWRGSQPLSWPAAILLGITWGLAASGLYQGGKAARSALAFSPSPYSPPGSKPAGEVKSAAAVAPNASSQPPAAAATVPTQSPPPQSSPTQPPSTAP